MRVSRKLSNVCLRVEGVENHVWHIHSDILFRAAGIKARKRCGAESADEELEIYVSWLPAFENQCEIREDTVSAILVIVYYCGARSREKSWNNTSKVTKALQTLITCEAPPHKVVDLFLQFVVGKLKNSRKFTGDFVYKFDDVPSTFLEDEKDHSVLEVVKHSLHGVNKALDICSRLMLKHKTNSAIEPKAPRRASSEIIKDLTDRLADAERKANRLSRLLQVKLEDNLKVANQLEKLVAQNRRLANGIPRHKKGKRNLPIERRNREQQQPWH